MTVEFCTAIVGWGLYGVIGLVAFIAGLTMGVVAAMPGPRLPLAPPPPPPVWKSEERRSA